MHRLSLLNTNKISLIIAYLVFIAVTFAAAMIGLVYPSNYSPLLLIGAITAAVIFFMWVSKPELALYVAIFVVLLPVGIMPLEIHSNLNRVLTIAVFVVWSLSVLLKRRRIYWTGTALVMLFFLAWCLLTMIWADNFDYSKTFFQIYSLRFVLFIFLIPNIINTKKTVDGLFITLALNGWALVIFSVVILIQSGYKPGSRFSFLDVNENGMSILVLITLLGIMWITTQLSQRKQVIKITLAVIYLLFMAVIVFISGSRGGAISFAIILISFLFWKTTRPWSEALLALLILAIVFSPTLFETTFERFLLTSRDSISILGGREALWSAAWRMIGDHPLGGVGIGNSGISLLSYLDIAGSAKETASAHNPILVIWGETGLFGILLYLGILISAVGEFARQYLMYRNISASHPFLPYFAFVSSVFMGYIVSWVKGGGMERDHTYFFMLALLLIPSVLDDKFLTFKKNDKI